MVMMLMKIDSGDDSDGDGGGDGGGECIGRRN